MAPKEEPAGIAGTGITVFAQGTDAPAPPPESFSVKKSDESNGVLTMVDNQVKGRDKEITVATATEKEEQAGPR